MKKVRNIFFVLLICFFSIGNSVQSNAQIKEDNFFKINEKCFESTIQNSNSLGLVKTIDMEIDSKVSCRLTISVSEISTFAIDYSKKVNIDLHGHFYLTSSGETVSTYGLSGSIYYDGKTANAEDGSLKFYSAYHDGKVKNWTGTYRTNQSGTGTAECTVKGNYDLFYKGDKNNSAYLQMKVDKNGYWEISGNYGQYNIN